MCSIVFQFHEWFLKVSVKKVMALPYLFSLNDPQVSPSQIEPSELGWVKASLWLSPSSSSFPWERCTAMRSRWCFHVKQSLFTQAPKKDVLLGLILMFSLFGPIWRFFAKSDVLQAKLGALADLFIFVLQWVCWSASKASKADVAISRPSFFSRGDSFFLGHPRQKSTSLEASASGNKSCPRQSDKRMI